MQRKKNESRHKVAQIIFVDNLTDVSEMQFLLSENKLFQI